MLFAPMSVTDLWSIEGSTHRNIELPAVPGDGGVGIIEEPGNSSFTRGDMVIPIRAGLGIYVF